MQFHHQYGAPSPPRPIRQFSQLEMPLSRAFQRLVEGGLIASLLPRPPPQQTPPGYQADLHCAYHRRAGHDTDSCAALRHTIQSLIDQGLVDLGRPGVTWGGLEGLIHILTADRATCILFSNDELPPEGLGHIRPLHISVACSGHRVPTVLLDNDSALNVCPLATTIALGFSPFNFEPST